jgi:hypothetical protein
MKLGGVDATGKGNGVEAFADATDVDANHSGTRAKQHAHDWASIFCTTASSCS